MYYTVHAKMPNSPRHTENNKIIIIQNGKSTNKIIIMEEIGFLLFLKFQ